MDEPIDQSAALFRVDYESMVREYSEGVAMGKTSRVSALDDIFKWTTGTINAFYGWASDGKGTFFDYVSVMAALFDQQKFCAFRQEDMSSTRFKNESPKMTANRIHRGLIWTYTGKCPDKNFCQKHGAKFLEKDEFMDAMQWVDDRFFIINPRDRSWQNVKSLFEFYWKEFGINHFLIDPFKSLRLEENRRGDFIMDDLFIDAKDFAVRTNTSVNFIAHPRSLTDVKQGKDINAPFRIVNQYMIAGGAAWDNNMDSQFSIYRPNRHNNPRDPAVQLHNLKQRNSEEVGADKGSVLDIKLNRNQRRYYFNGRCPITGDTWTEVQYTKQALIDYSEPKNKTVDLEELPF